MSTSVEGLIKAVFINSESADKFEFVDLGLDPLDIANYLSELYITWALLLWECNLEARRTHPTVADVEGWEIRKGLEF